MNTDRLNNQTGKKCQTLAWLFVGLGLSIAGMAIGAVMLIWHLADLILR